MNKIIPILLAFMVGATAPPAASQSQRDSLLSVVPPAGVFTGWSRTDSAQVYTGKDLYRFIDGGADLFFEYGFRQALAAEYHGGGNESINLEVYEMNDAGAAFGIYSVRSGSEAKPTDIGNGGSAHAYYLMFWKGRFYISVAASDSSTECRRGVEAIARAVDRNLLTKAQKPPIMGSLPIDNLIKEQYFRGYLGLSSIRLLELEEMFPASDGAVGTYGDHSLILLSYRSPSEARDRLADVISKMRADKNIRVSPQRNEMVCVSDTKSRKLCLGRSRSLIIISVSSKETVAASACKSAMRTSLGR